MELTLLLSHGGIDLMSANMELTMSLLSLACVELTTTDMALTSSSAAVCSTCEIQFCWCDTDCSAGGPNGSMNSLG